MPKEKYFAQPSGTMAQSHFSQVPKAEIERSRFDRSHGLKTTFDAGFLIPVYVDEVLPGDSFDMNATGFCRLATPLKPLMDNIYLDIHFWFCPYRLVWDNWEKFMGQRDTPDEDNTGLIIPRIGYDTSTILPNHLLNYFGFPKTEIGGIAAVSALPIRAYGLIWNEHYRDQNLQNPLPVRTDDSPAAIPNVMPQRRGKRHDYFTSCLPWPQKGDPVYIPIAESAPVVRDPEGSGIPGFYIDGTADERSLIFAQQSGGTANQVGYSGANSNTGKNLVWATTGLMADLTVATAITINDLRTAFQIQKLLERDARGGTRYIELILSHFGVQSDDGRLQRPEYLGGGTQMMSINPVAQTVPVTDSPQANLAATGTAIGKAGFHKSFTEHGVIIGLVSTRADLTYQQGVERFWFRLTRYDFYWPALAHLGEQAVKQREIYFLGRDPDDQEVFGYQERYAEYRYKPSRITGAFNSTAATSLDVWHLAQDFALPPVLNGPFIHEDPPIDRVIAVPDEPHFLLDMWFSLQCARPMPIYSVPGLIDHF